MSESKKVKISFIPSKFAVASILQMMPRTTLIAIFLFFCLPSLILADTATEIETLLDYVRTSNATFIRNGQEYTPAQAVDHMQKKRQHFAKDIKSAEDFIGMAGTKSLVSGQPYLVKTKDGRTQECSLWLLDKLREMRGDHSRLSRDSAEVPTAPTPAH